MKTTTSEEILARLKAMRDQLLAENADNSVPGDRWSQGYGSGVEAMWEVVEGAVKGAMANNDD